MTNLFGSLDIEIWDFLGIWCLEFDISEYLNTRDSVSIDYRSIGYSTVKFHMSVPLGDKGQHQRERKDPEQGRNHDSGGCEPDVAV